ncbi:MAG: hypothetical protein K2K74_07155 [Lachnospiraceae bacterium]|nr:hypothetical protein [Lachnospiraceae bacterium]
MVKKLTTKQWQNMIILSLVIGVIPGIVLLKFAPKAIQALSGSIPESAKAESARDTYVICLFALFFIVIYVLSLIDHLTHSVGKKVKNYLTANPWVTMEQLDSDFEAAETIESVWIGRRWTFCGTMNAVPVENDKIVLVYSEYWRSKRFELYYLCLGLLDGTVVKTGVTEKSLPKFMELYGRYPHILVGNNERYIQMFKNDRNALLDIKYRSSHV